jgi:CheY-like chemotaxis protein
MLPVILFVDDDDIMPLVLQRAIKVGKIGVRLESVSSGDQAVDYLLREGKYEDALLHPFPSVVLLDLNMPGMNGFDVLEWKRDQPQLSSLPVVVWSSSFLPEDKHRAMAFGASDYIVKPMNLEELTDVLRWVGEFPVRHLKQLERGAP